MDWTDAELYSLLRSSIFGLDSVLTARHRFVGVGQLLPTLVMTTSSDFEPGRLFTLEGHANKVD